jgi:hypothetical protein
VLLLNLVWLIASHYMRNRTHSPEATTTTAIST